MPPSAEPPVLPIVAGPNGSGKSSAYQDTDIEAFGRSVWIINPDLLAARIREVEGLEPVEANLESVCRIEAWLEIANNIAENVMRGIALARRDFLFKGSDAGGD